MRSLPNTKTYSHCNIEYTKQAADVKLYRFECSSLHSKYIVWILTEHSNVPPHSNGIQFICSYMHTHTDMFAICVNDCVLHTTINIHMHGLLIPPFSSILLCVYTEWYAEKTFCSTHKIREHILHNTRHTVSVLDNSAMQLYSERKRQK